MGISPLIRKFAAEEWRNSDAAIVISAGLRANGNPEASFDKVGRLIVEEDNAIAIRAVCQIFLMSLINGGIKNSDLLKEEREAARGKAKAAKTKT